MKIATGIISLIIGLIVFLQSCAVGIGGAVLADETTSQSGSVGLFVAFLLWIAGAFAFALPKVAMVISAIAGIFALMNGATSDYADMTVWGGYCFHIGYSRILCRSQTQKIHSNNPTATNSNRQQASLITMALLILLLLPLQLKRPTHPLLGMVGSLLVSSPSFLSTSCL